MNAPEIHQKVCLECNRQFTGIVAACPHDGTLLVKVQTDSLIGSVLDGAYEVISIIGHGGMGVVYKARHTLMDRVVAIKMLKATLISDSMSVKRFQQEVKASARIDHPHAITVYNFGVSPEGLPYIVMDFLQGSSLAEVIKAEGHVEVDRGVKIIMQACEALAHAHKQGVVHRDLKPSNIVLTEYDDDPDFVKVVDFGVAKLMGGSAETAQRLTQTGEVCGSPVYMSPEQCMGQELDLRSDIYSMGILIYETLTGKLPLIGRTMVDTMSKHVSENPPPFSKTRPDLYIPERIEQVVMKAMSKDPADRHQNMDELREDLENAIPKPGRSSSLRNTQTASLRDRDPNFGMVPGGSQLGRRLPFPAIIAGAAVALGVLVLAIFGAARNGAPALQKTQPGPPALTAPAGVAPAATTPAQPVVPGAATTAAPVPIPATGAAGSEPSSSTVTSPAVAPSTSTSVPAPTTSQPAIAQPTGAEHSTGATTASQTSTNVAPGTGKRNDEPFSPHHTRVSEIQIKHSPVVSIPVKKVIKKHPGGKPAGQAGEDRFADLRHQYLDNAAK